MSELNPVIELIKADRKAEARRILIDILKQDRDNQQAWLYLAACANGKSEFEQSIQQVLRINPRNQQALRLAEKHNIPLPDDVLQSIAAAEKQAEKSQKKSRRQRGRERSRSGGGGGRRLLRVVLLLLLILLGAAAVFFFLTQDSGDDTDDVESETIAGDEATPEDEETPEATPEDEDTPDPTPEDEETPEATPEDEDTPDPTEETPEATDEADDEGQQSGAAAVTPTPTPTPEEEPEPTVEPSPTPTEEPALPIFEDAGEYFEGVSVQSGASPEDLSESTTYDPDDTLFVVVEVGDRGEALGIEIIIMPENSTGRDILPFSRQVDPGEAESVPIAIRPPGASWAAAIWLVSVRISGVEVDGTRFVIVAEDAEDIEASEDTEVAAADDEDEADPVATEESADPEAEADTEEADTAEEADTEEAEITISAPTEPPNASLVYDEDSLYIINLTEENLNISELVFTQTLSDGTESTMSVGVWDTGFTGVGSIFALQPQSCMQVGLTPNAASPTPVDCVRLSNWQSRSFENPFWQPVEAETNIFIVFWIDVPIAECDVNANSCDIVVPIEDEVG